jgi:hypothetical protein
MPNVAAEIDVEPPSGGGREAFLPLGKIRLI